MFRGYDDLSSDYAALLRGRTANVRMFGGGSLPPGTQKPLRVLAKKTGLDVEVEAASDMLIIKLKRGGSLVGYFRVSTVITDGFMWEKTPEECKTAWSELGELPLWAVRGAEWYDTSFKGQGLGSLAYTAMFEYVRAQHGVVGPDMCAGGVTSAEAQRVWDRFRSRYKMHGPLLHFASASGSLSQKRVQGSQSRKALVRMKAPAFRRKGRQFKIHEMVGVKKEKWEDLPFSKKIQLVQDYYLKLSKRPKLSGILRKHLNGMKRWFNIQKRKHKPWRSRIESFFTRRVKRIQDQKKRRGEGPKRKTAVQEDLPLRRALVHLAYHEPELRKDILSLLSGD